MMTKFKYAACVVCSTRNFDGLLTSHYTGRKHVALIKVQQFDQEWDTAERILALSREVNWRRYAWALVIP